jgi:hypothetical protein
MRKVVETKKCTEISIDEISMDQTVIFKHTNGSIYKLSKMVSLSGPDKYMFGNLEGIGQGWSGVHSSFEAAIKSAFSNYGQIYVLDSISELKEFL